ncbi:hypothetical protein BpHYR1_005071 [Brachionus plicatilis]|uniref:Uncharacterized protein n=1 Tax=Brachionus plicatilis TaxID=10195 RepID=A0A3M7PS11_BRAPC|nr:hypothetical protein BpHYR1_005071 [Brachionus plicatilis]
MALSHLTLLVEQTLLAAPNAAISAWHAKLREADRALSFISSSFVSFNLKEDHFFTKIFCLVGQIKYMTNKNIFEELSVKNTEKEISQFSL